MFYEYCTKCSKSFQNETEWNAHNLRHKRKFAKTEKDKLEPPKHEVIPETNQADIEDERLAKCRDLRALKKILKENGIECGTMTKDEVKKAYEDLVASGKVKA